ncbi:MAG: hypothetical protein J6X44_08745, partial [Thermoguttaceae bacterium]|nr:hypothetical protein [Thermoguttaceae bacterium]
MSSRFTMRNLFQSLRTKSASHDATKRPNRARTLRLEALESRELLDAAGYMGAVTDADLVPTIVTTVADVVDANDGHISLREAISNVADNGTTPVEINFAPSVMGGEIKLELGTLAISNKNIKINAWTTQDQTVTPGGGEGTAVAQDAKFLGGVSAVKGVAIDGVDIEFDSAQAKDEPIIEITDGSVVVLTGLTVTNSGSTIGANASGFDGVGILVNESARLDFCNCSVRGVDYYEGGAIVVKDTTDFRMTNVLVADNVAYTNGSGANGYSSAIDAHGVTQIDFFNCTIVNNHSKNSGVKDFGVALDFAGLTAACKFSLINSILVENTNSVNGSSEVFGRRASSSQGSTHTAYSFFAKSVVGKVQNP